MNEELFTRSCAALDKEYDRLGQTERFRFLTCSKQAFRADIPALILDKYPSPNETGEADPVYFCEKGNAYLVERWFPDVATGQAKIQRRMKPFFQDLKSVLSSPLTLSEFADHGILSAYHDPFRGGTGKRSFLNTFWREILQEIQPPLIFSFGKPGYDMLENYATRFSSGSFLQVAPEIPAQGTYHITCAIMECRGRKSLVTCIPSLARYAYDKVGSTQEAANAQMWNIVRQFLSSKS